LVATAGTNGTTLAGSYSAPALTTLDLSATVTDARAAFSGAAQTGDYAAGFAYTWDALTSQCGIVEVLDGAGIDASVKLIDIGSYTVHCHSALSSALSFSLSLFVLLVRCKADCCLVCAAQMHLCTSDGELASEKVVSMFITASKPQLSRQPSLSIIEIPGTRWPACALARVQLI
jgi:hypothetical protein